MFSQSINYNIAEQFSSESKNLLQSPSRTQNDATKSQPQDPQRSHPLPETCLQQKIHDRYGFCDNRRTYDYGSRSKALEAALLKYYPKYCHSLYFDDREKSRAILSRIKQIKTISHIEYDFGHYPSFEMKKTFKKLLANKRKSLKSLPVVDFQEEFGYRAAPLTFPAMSAFFPNIQTLKIALPEDHFGKLGNLEFISEPMETEILQSYGYFWTVLKHVQHLDLTTMSPNLWMILPYLQDSKDFLARLKTFRLTIMSYNNRNDKSHTPRTIFQSVLKNQDLLKYVTSINFQRFKHGNERAWFHYYGDQIKSIIDCCPKLRSIAFPISWSFFSLQRQFPTTKHYLTLAPLQSLQNLAALTLFVDDVWALIEAFEFPLQLQKLTLHLYILYHFFRELYERVNDKNSSGTQMKAPNPEKHDKLSTFLGKFKNLTLLHSLDLKVPSTAEPGAILNKLILPVIKAVSNLERLDLLFYSGYIRENSTIDLSMFLEAIAAPEKLRSFKIVQMEKEKSEFTDKNDLVITFNPQKTFSFLNLTSFTIDTLISEDFDFKTFFKVFSSEGSSIQRKLIEINLAKIHITSAKSFIKLLKIFKEAEQFETLKINLGIILSISSMTDFNKNFKYLIIPANNVKMTLDIYIKSSSKIELNEKEIMKMQNVFGKVRFSVTLWGEDKSKKKAQAIYTPVMKNNHLYIEDPDAGYELH